jgi:ribosomal protein L2
MILKKLNPVTNGTRHQFNLKKSLLSKKNNIIKNLIKNLKLNYGRSSSTGHITVRHKGNGCKKKIHILNNYLNSYALTICQFYSSFHNTFISLNFDLKKRVFFKTVATFNLYSGSLVLNQNKIKD